jgi:phosphonate utilization transcriptional regulator
VAAPARKAAASAAGAPPRATIALLQAHSLTSVVHAEIERLILAGELPPGAKLTEAMLAQRLGVSRGPIREAFRMLEESGLVQLEKNRGVFVRQIALDEAVEIYDLRAMLDEAVGRQLAQAISADRLKALRAQVDQMDKLAKATPRGAASAGYHRLNLAFHDLLVDSTGNRKLVAMYRRVVNELSLVRRANLADGRQIATSVAEHRAILKAIAAGDADAAGRALRAHAQDSKQRMLAKQAALAAAGAAPLLGGPGPGPGAGHLPVTDPAPATAPRPTARKTRHATAA